MSVPRNLIKESERRRGASPVWVTRPLFGSRPLRRSCDAGRTAIETHSAKAALPASRRHIADGNDRAARDRRIAARGEILAGSEAAVVLLDDIARVEAGLAEIPRAAAAEAGEIPAPQGSDRGAVSRGATTWDRGAGGGRLRRREIGHSLTRLSMHRRAPPVGCRDRVAR